MKGVMRIRWHEAAINDLSGITFEQLSVEYRSEAVTALVVRLKNLPQIAVVLLSPVGFLFRSPLLVSELLSGYGGGMSVDRSAETENLYARELRQAKIGKHSPQAHLLGRINSRYGSRDRRLFSLSLDQRYMESLRFVSYGFDNQWEPQVRHHLEMGIAQLGDYAMVSFPEEESYHDVEDATARTMTKPRKENLGHWLMNWGPLNLGLLNEDDNNEVAARVLAELKRSIERLESSQSFDVAMDVFDRVKCCIRLSCDVAHVRLLTAEVLSRRARLVRLLGDPGYLRAVEREVPRLRENWPQLADGKVLPYDPLEELECYRTAMLERYPILNMSPFGNAAAS